MTESFLHSDMKYDIYWSLLTDAYADVEITLGKSRTDVFTEVNGKQLAIEIQYTPILASTIYNRILEHTRQGAYTLWLIPEESIIRNQRVVNLQWLKDVQTLQEGVIFLPHKNRKQVIPARIDLEIIFHKDSVVASKKRVLDTREPIDLDELEFKTNEDGLNIVTYPEWWLESVVELF